MSTQRFSESDLPFTSAPEELSDVSEDEVASDLAALGYPALSQFKAKGKLAIEAVGPKAVNRVHAGSSDG